jgi:hypothetical protein
VVRSAASPASAVAIVCYVLRRKKFRFGHAVQAIQGGLLDVDVLADHVGGDASVAQPQCQLSQAVTTRSEVVPGRRVRAG